MNYKYISTIGILEAVTLRIIKLNSNKKDSRTIKIKKKLSIQLTRFTAVNIYHQYVILKKLRLNYKYIQTEQ